MHTVDPNCPPQAMVVRGMSFPSPRCLRLLAVKSLAAVPAAVVARKHEAVETLPCFVGGERAKEKVEDLLLDPFVCRVYDFVNIPSSA